MIVRSACTLDALDVKNYMLNSGINLTVTVNKNNVDTAITCTAGTAPSTCADTAHTVSLAVNDVVSLKLVTSTGGGFATAANGSLMVSLHCQ